MSGGEAPKVGDTVNLTAFARPPVPVPVGYAPAYGAPVYVCVRCGSAVTFVDVHDEWHERLWRATAGAM